MLLALVFDAEGKFAEGGPLSLDALKMLDFSEVRYWCARFSTNA
jgi:hypothetical protein